MRNVRPIRDNILIRELPLPEFSDGKHGIAILLSDWARENSKNGLLGVVEAVGPGVWSDEGKLLKPSVKVGDIVWYPRWHGAKGSHSVVPEDTALIFLKPIDVLAVDESAEARAAADQMYADMATGDTEAHQRSCLL